MRLASGTIASLVLSIGALLFLAAVDYSSNTVLNSGRRPPKSSFLRSSTRRKLYNYSSNRYNNNYNTDGGYNENYGYTENNQNNGYESGYSSDNSNYQNNGGYNDQNSYNQDYDNSNYIWANDDAAAAYGNYNDDNSYYNSNKAYQADAYNGRDQTWGGQSVQAYTDDEEPEIQEEGYVDDDRWFKLGEFGGLTASESFAVAALAVFASMTVLFLALLACGFNIVDLCQLYCCCGLFSHTDETGDAIEDTFVKLGDY